jgi:cobalt-zinc-cadmium efflux system outer membrane protein
MTRDKKIANRKAWPQLGQLKLRLMFFMLFGVTACSIQDYKPTPLAGFMVDDGNVPPARAIAGKSAPLVDEAAPRLQPEAPPAVSAYPPSLSVQDAIAATLSSPDILSAAENITQASAALWTASTPPNPTLILSQTLNPLNRPFTAERQGGPPQFDAGISFPIDWLVFGKRSAAMESAKLETDWKRGSYWSWRMKTNSIFAKPMP